MYDLLCLYAYVSVTLYMWFNCEAHPICVCVAMIVYAVHGSRCWWCKWLWCSLVAERGLTWGNSYVYLLVF